MRRFLFIIVAAIWMIPMTLKAQTYSTLWKQVEQAQEKDLPQTAIGHLQTIVAKATKERAYGQLLKATLLTARLQAEVAPDSLQPAVGKLEQQEQQAKDPALKAVYDVVLAKIYESNSRLADDWQARQQEYAQRAKAQPDVLAATRTDGYVPFVVKGKDSELYGHDLLSVVGAELGDWQWLSDYYTKAGNRRAACLTALEAAGTTAQVDSLIALYGDLPEAGELAIKRYDLMHSATAREKADWLQQALQRWGSWRRANSLRNSWTALTQPCYHTEVARYVMEVGKPQTVYLKNLRHLEQLTMRVYRTQLAGDTELSPNDSKDLQKIKAGSVEMKDHQRTLRWHGHDDYELFEDSLELNGLPAGVYLLEFSTQPQTSVERQLYYVSGVRWMSQPMPDNRQRFVVVDATTGQPIGGAKIRLKTENGRSQQTKTLATNEEGELVYHQTSDYRYPSVFVTTADDRFLPPARPYNGYSYYERSYDGEHTQLFTDRSIYRPGQTVVVTAVVWKELSALDNKAVEGKHIKIELRDANYKLVAEQGLTTDRYGKCSTELTLPAGLLNGRFTIRANGGSTSIRVEEYKRPTFQVEFPEHKAPYQAGDTVHAEGKAMTYAGVPVQDAKVHYLVRRQVAFWWMNYSWYWQSGYVGRSLQNEVVGEGDTVTAADGTFVVDMPMMLPDDMGRRPMFYHFVVEADVTDQGGETHSATMTLPLGNKPTALTCDLPQQVRQDQLPPVVFRRCNAAGKEIVGVVRYRLDKGKWQQADANSPHTIFRSVLKSGEHRLEAVCEQDTIDMKFVVFGLGDKKPATETDDWFYVSHSQFPADGSPVTLQVGASDPDLYIVYGIYAGNRIIESGAVRKSSELINRRLAYQEEYGNGLLVTYAWVKNGVCHSHQTVISRPLPDKQLHLQWETFRDRLTPGQQEEWRLSIKKADGTPADASLMAVLYDKSLDAIAPHQWLLKPTISLAQPSTSWRMLTGGALYGSGALNYKPLQVPEFEYSRFDDSVYPYYVTRVFRSRPMLMAKSAASSGVAVGNAMVAVEESKVYDSVEAMAAVNAVGQGTTADEDGAATEKTADVQVRENLNETAFCYPHLTTDKEGGVVLRFTLPESLTTWRFMGVANTADMLYGTISGETVAQKEVMVQPNVPRFVRMGDEAQVSARIFNTTGHVVNGAARLQLIDPETEGVVYEQVQPFAVEAGKTGVVHYPVSVVHCQSSLLVCKVTAQGDGFSDGEQHYLPVLPDREFVTKTVPYTQHEPGVKTIDLTALFPQDNTSGAKLTVEYTNNPAWLVVQSLPVVGQPWEHSAIDQAASYYSNLLAKTLLDRNPKVKTVFEQWKREAAGQPSLISQLQKNEELKDLVLAETPWVAAADRENDQKQHLADFFDENTIANRLDMAIEKLAKLQRADGSFSWYPGMEGSVHITVAVEEMLVRLNNMVGEQQATRQLQAKAFDFIGKEMVELVARMKQEERKGHRQSFPSFAALRWLYLCAVDGRQLPAGVKGANDYLIGLLKKDIKQQTIYEKALTAVVLAKHGERTKAAEYVKSLKEYTVYTEEMGRYYDTQRAAYSWYDYKIPTEVAAIEAIGMLTPQDRQTVDEMRRWLLQEKRTQAWNTPVNSVNAIYAFLNATDAESPLNTQGAPTVLAIDGTPLDTPQATAGIGYVKTAVSEPKGHTFTATKTSEGTSWGAVYAQFFQKTADIEAAQSGITIKRELLPLASGLSPQNALQVGARVKVRLTIESTRDLDFVQVVDRRAACMEPVHQLSGYQNGAYVSPKDYATHYYYRWLAKGKHVIETEYYIDRAGHYETGTCTVGCAYAPEYRATAPSLVINAVD